MKYNNNVGTYLQNELFDSCQSLFCEYPVYIQNKFKLRNRKIKKLIKKESKVKNEKSI